MWIFSTLGFFSVVRKSADEVHVRARCRDDLEALARFVEGSAGVPSGASRPARLTGKLTPVASHPGSDYPWRIIVRASTDLELVMSVLAASIDYSNFKSAVAASPAQRSKGLAYHDIHRRMVEWQEGGGELRPEFSKS